MKKNIQKYMILSLLVGLSYQINSGDGKRRRSFILDTFDVDVTVAKKRVDEIAHLERVFTDQEEAFLRDIVKNWSKDPLIKEKAQLLLAQNDQTKEALSHIEQSKQESLYSKQLADFRKKADYKKYGYEPISKSGIHAAKIRAALEVLGLTNDQAQPLGNPATDVDTVKKVYNELRHAWVLRSQEPANLATQADIQEIIRIIDEYYGEIA